MREQIPRKAKIPKSVESFGMYASSAWGTAFVVVARRKACMLIRLEYNSMAPGAPFSSLLKMLALAISVYVARASP